MSTIISRVSTIAMAATVTVTAAAIATPSKKRQSCDLPCYERAYKLIYR